MTNFRDPRKPRIRQLNERIVAANASPVGFVGLHAATGYASTKAGTATQIAGYLEERFEATGSRGGFMLGHSQAGHRALLQFITGLLVSELQRRAGCAFSTKGGSRGKIWRDEQATPPGDAID